MSDEDPVSSRQEKQKHLAELEEFMKNSRVYKGYVAARAEEIDATKEAILFVEPINRETEIEGLKLRGELRCLEQLLTTFEDARQTLKDRIEELLEREQQNVGKDTQ